MINLIELVRKKKAIYIYCNDSADYLKIMRYCNSIGIKWLNDEPTLFPNNMRVRYPRDDFPLYICMQATTPVKNHIYPIHGEDIKTDYRLKTNDFYDINEFNLSY